MTAHVLSICGLFAVIDRAYKSNMAIVTEIAHESQKVKLTLEIRSLLYNLGKTLKLNSNFLEYEISTDKAGRSDRFVSTSRCTRKRSGW